MGDGGISRPFIGAQNQKNPTLAQFLAKKLHPLASTRQSPTRPGVREPITIVCISDTHNSKPPLPDGDILLHAGDLSQYGTFAEIQSQLNWLNSQPHRHKIAIAGNHDLLLDASFVEAHPDRELDKPGKSRQDLSWGDVIYL